MNKTLVKLTCGLALLSAAAISAQAQGTITYTVSGVCDYTLGATFYANKGFTLTTVANAGDITASAGTYPYYLVSGTTTIQLEKDSGGLTTAAFNGGDTFGIASLNLNSLHPGQGEIMFLDTISYKTLLSFYDTVPTYDLTTALNFTPTLDGNVSDTFSTDKGVLQFSHVYTTGSFSSSGIEPTPEPSTLALAAMGGVGSLLLYRRRK